MWREAPEDVFLRAYRSQIQPVTIHILEFPYLARLDQALHLSNGRMEEKKMTNHKIYPLCLRHRLEIPCLIRL